MGAGRWDSAKYASFSASTVGRSTEEVYSSREMKSDLDPKNAKLRESRDSAENPNSTAIIVALDVTGSMHVLADTIARKGLGVLFQKILDEKPVSDPHLMFMGVGDVIYDRAPLQVSQFEADARIIEQLTQIWIEHGGGGNNFESYNLPWYFGAVHTSIDCYEKRGRKGYLFTVGDEEAPRDLTQEQLIKVFGDQVVRGLTNKELLEQVGKMYHVFHVIIEEGNYARGHGDAVRQSWAHTLGQNVIHLSDHTKLAEVVVAAIAATEGVTSGPTDPIVIAATRHLLSHAA